MRIGRLSLWVWGFLLSIGILPVAPAVAAPTITVTASGDVKHDFGASFGSFPGGQSGIDLSAAQTVQIVHTFVENPGDVTAGDPSVGLFSLASVAISIDGGSAVVFDAASASGVFGLYQVATLGSGIGSFVDSLITLSGLTPDDNSLESGINISSNSVPVVTSASIYQNLSFFAAPAPGQWTMGASLSDDQGATLWAVVGDVESVTVVVTGLAVPEAGTLWVALLALALLALRHRAWLRTVRRP